MKRLTNHLEVFDFFEANGIYVEVWPTKEALIILLPYLPWWAWIRRSWQKGAVERFRKNAAAEWKLSIIEAASDDAQKQEYKRKNTLKQQQEANRRQWLENHAPTGKLEDSAPDWKPPTRPASAMPTKTLPICHSNHWLFGKPLKSRCSDAQCKHKESCSAYQDNKVVDSSAFLPPSPVEGCRKAPSVEIVDPRLLHRPACALPDHFDVLGSRVGGFRAAASRLDRVDARLMATTFFAGKDARIKELEELLEAANRKADSLADRLDAISAAVRERLEVEDE